MTTTERAVTGARTTSTRATATRTATPRGPDDPEPDLCDYRVVHRAMTTDLARLASVADDLAGSPDLRRLRLLRRYLRGVSAEIVNHHRVEDDDVWPLLEAVAADRTALVALTEDHERLDPLLARAGELAAADTATPELAGTLHELADLLARHVRDEERDVFPIITERVRVEDYARLQERFRGTLGLRVLTFVVPWVVGHATPDERAALLADAPSPLRVLLAVTERRFRARAALLFGTGLSPADQRMVRLMKAITRAQVAIVRVTAAGGATGGSRAPRSSLSRRPDAGAGNRARSWCWFSPTATICSSPPRTAGSTASRRGGSTCRPTHMRR